MQNVTFPYLKKSHPLFYSAARFTSRLGTAVSVMAKIPLLECLTRHSYRESLEKSSSPRPRTEAEPDVGEGRQTSSQSAILCPTEVRQTSGGSAAQDGAVGRSSSSNCGLQEALEEEKEQDEADKMADAPSFNVTLLDWINVQDRPNDVEAVVRKCFDSINRVSKQARER